MKYRHAGLSRPGSRARTALRPSDVRSGFERPDIPQLGTESAIRRTRSAGRSCRGRIPVLESAAAGAGCRGDSLPADDAVVFRRRAHTVAGDLAHREMGRLLIGPRWAGKPGHLDAAIRFRKADATDFV